MQFGSRFRSGLVARCALVFVASFSLAGCSVYNNVFNKKNVVHVPERILDEGTSYSVGEETAFFLTNPNDSEPDRMLPEGSAVEYVGPGPEPQIVIVCVDDGTEGYIYSRSLEEIEKKKPVDVLDLAGPGPEITITDPIDPSESDEPEIRIDDLGDIKPRDLDLGPIGPR